MACGTARWARAGRETRLLLGRHPPSQRDEFGEPPHRLVGEGEGVAVFVDAAGEDDDAVLRLPGEAVQVSDHGGGWVRGLVVVEAFVVEPHVKALVKSDEVDRVASDQAVQVGEQSAGG